MADFEVILTKKARKELDKIPGKDQNRVKSKLIKLEENPFIGKRLKGELEKLLGIRIWPYRAVYWIEKRTVWVVKIQHRQGVYK